MQSLMKLANKKGNEVGPEVVDEIESESINVVSNTQLKVQPSRCAAADKPLNMSLQGSEPPVLIMHAMYHVVWHAEGSADWRK